MGHIVDTSFNSDITHVDIKYWFSVSFKDYWEPKELFHGKSMNKFKKIPMALRREGGSGVIFACLAHMKVLLSLNSCFLLNEAIVPWEKVINLWRLAVWQLSYRNIKKEFGQNLIFWSIFLCFLTLDDQKLVEMVEFN